MLRHCEFYKIFKNTFLIEHLRWLLLTFEIKPYSTYKWKLLAKPKQKPAQTSFCCKLNLKLKTKKTKLFAVVLKQDVLRHEKKSMKNLSTEVMFKYFNYRLNIVLIGFQIIYSNQFLEKSLVRPLEIEQY